MDNLPFTIYENDNLLVVPEDNSVPLIEDILFKDDLIMMIAEDKMGKTVLATQMACCLSSGTPFLGIFDIPEPVPVWYFYHEGKQNDTIARLVRHSHGTTVDKNNLKVMIGSRFRWNDPDCKKHIDALLMKYADNLPKVIIVDPLYASCLGDLNANPVMSEFIHVLRCVAQHCGASIVLIHHMKKQQRDVQGNMYKRNDSDAYGSAVMKWAVDHVFRLAWYKYGKMEEVPKDKRKWDRWLKCNTQRGGNIASGIRLRMEEPDPLFFYSVGHYESEKHKVMSLLRANRDGMGVAEMEKKSKISRGKLYQVFPVLLEEGLITKSDGRPVIYRGVDED